MAPVSPVLLTSVVDFPETVWAKDQPQYLQLPSLVARNEEGTTTTRWKLTWKERFQVLIGGNIWLQQLTFHRSLQPVKLTTTEPPIEECV